MVGSTSVLKAIPQDVLNRLRTAKETRVSLKHLYILGKQVNKNRQTPSPAIKIPSEFLCSELPIRYGHMLKTLHSHPLANASPSMQKVANRYVSDAQLLTRLTVPTTESETSQFLEVLHTLRRRQCGSLLRLRHGLLTEAQGDDGAQDSLQAFLDQCNGLGVGVNLLIGEHLCLHDRGHNLVQQIDPVKVAQNAIQEAQRYCSEIHNVTSPQVQLVCKYPNLSTTYVPAHLHRILFELLTNSLTATIKNKKTAAVKLTLVKGHEDVTIRLSDEGGGISAREMQSAWRYHVKPHHNALLDHDEDDAQVEFDSKRGLRFARLLARYFGGDLNLISMEGYGTDAFLALSRDDAVMENYPVSNLTESELY